MRILPQVILLSVVLACAGCSGGSGGGKSFQGERDGNSPPTIAGVPEAVVHDGDFYEFRPAARDADGDALTFAIGGKPEWAKFDPATGRLWGTPGGRDTGTYRDIRITVSDGANVAALETFDIAVNAVFPGVATLSWDPPTDNADGSYPADLAGYRIYYGKSASRLDRTVVIDNPGLTRYMVENLSPARWHFAMTSITTGGVESRRSRIVSKRVV
jgi:hypothetical protein